VSSVAWSPDGRRLLLSAGGVAVADVETEQIDVVVPFGSDAVWSPGGGEIAFEGGGDCKDRSGIYRAGADGSDLRRLTNDCRLVGTANADQIQGTELADVILGLEGNDILGAYDAAYVGDDVYGGPGDDTLIGHYLGDLLEGGEGDDSIEALWGPDLLRGGPGRDLLQGQGGRDYLDAEDGVRDVVSCGTNPNPWPPAELDTAFVDGLDRVSGCELVYRNGRANLRAGRTALTITVGRAAGRRSWTLRCRPAGGSLPKPGRACRRLATMRGPLAPIAYDRTCTTTPAGAGEATVRGLFAGKRVVVPFYGSNTCEIERWDRHRFLFEPR
jgi:Ca2+-binding RTX toxin-like protein